MLTIRPSSVGWMYLKALTRRTSKELLLIEPAAEITKSLFKSTRLNKCLSSTSEMLVLSMDDS